MRKIVAVLSIIAAVFVFGCARQNEPSSLMVPVPGYEGAKETVVEIADDEASIDVAEGEEQSAVKESTAVKETAVKEFTMKAKRFEFAPSIIIVNKGDKVRIKLTSADVAHGFSLPEFGINERIEPGKESLIEFIAGKTGTFEFKCSVYCGSGHGSMKGSLVVN